MKTAWEPKKKAPSTGVGEQLVTRAELPGLVRRIVADAMVQHFVIVNERPPAPKGVKRPRVDGHKHRGPCGKRCFNGGL